MNKKQLEQGFTIVELLVVISIIALLIGILVPAVQKARDSAKVTQSKSNIHQVMLALQTYASDHNDRNFTAAPDNLSTGERRGMNMSQAIDELSEPGTAFDLGIRLGNVGEDDSGIVYSMSKSYVGDVCGVAPYCFQSGKTESLTGRPGYGVWRYPNAMQVAEYMDGDTLHDAYFAPKDEVPLRAIEDCDDVTGSYCLTAAMAESVLGNPAGGTVQSNMFAVPSSYCISPCMMYNPGVYQLHMTSNPNQRRLPTDPMWLQRGFKPPALDQARYPSHKTWLMEHNWLQNTDTSNECNRSHVEKGTWFVTLDGGAYGDGCTPGHFNTHPDSSPVTVFADGAVKTYIVNDFITDSARVDADPANGDPLGGLWMTSEKMTQLGDLAIPGESSAFDNGPNTEYFSDVAEIKSGGDPLDWGGHTHTKDGIRGRDKLAK